MENHYTDRDYLIDFANYYVRCFEEYERLCKRLHFFKISFDEKKFFELLKINNHDLPDVLQDNYLGFIVAKPLPETIFGRSILTTYPTEGYGRHFPAIKRYETNLFGKTLEIKSLAFQEQDTVTAACATCALWVAFQKTADIFDRSWSPTPIEITKAATKYKIRERPVPSSGLLVEQMCQAIQEFGLEPQIVDIAEIQENKQFVPIQSLIYSYLEMGIPVLLGGTFIGGVRDYHVVTITGYHLEDKPFVKREVPNLKKINYCNLKGRRIDKFYTHDDAVGPFCKMLIKPYNRRIIKFYSNPDVDYQVWKEIIPEMIIIPLYEKIRIPFQEVYGWILKFNTFLETVEAIPKESLEWDIHLAESKSFKNDLLIKEEYKVYGFESLLKRMPRYIWRCSAETNNKKVVELIADATDMPKSFFITQIFFMNDDFKNNLKEKMIQKDIRKHSNTKLTEHFTKLIDDSI